MSEAELVEALRRIERKVDTLIAALAMEEEGEEFVKSLDGGREFAPRNDRGGLG